MNATRLFWRGDWASTYRLLHLVLVDGRPVLPLYVIDRTRPTLETELQAMDRLREATLRRTPGLRPLFPPPVSIALEDVPDDPEISRQFAQVLSGLVPARFEPLARFAKALGGSVELPLLRDDRSLLPALRPYLRERESDGLRRYVVEDFPGLAENHALSHLLFPLAGTERAEAAEAACREGFADLLRETCFCSAPRGDVPCGGCAECEAVIRSCQDGGRPLPDGMKNWTRQLLLPLGCTVPESRGFPAKAEADAVMGE